MRVQRFEGVHIKHKMKVLLFSWSISKCIFEFEVVCHGNWMQRFILAFVSGWLLGLMQCLPLCLETGEKPICLSENPTWVGEKKTHHDHEQLLHTASSWLWRPQCYWETKFLTYSQPPRWSLPPTLPSNYHQHHNNTGQWSTVLWSVPWSRGNFHKGETNFSNTLSNSSSDMVVSNIRKRIG